MFEANSEALELKHFSHLQKLQKRFCYCRNMKTMTWERVYKRI